MTTSSVWSASRRGPTMMTFTWTTSVPARNRHLARNCGRGLGVVRSRWARRCPSRAFGRDGGPQRQSTSPSTINEEYGLLWWIIGEPEGAGYSADGRGGQRIVVLPKSRAVIVCMSDVQPDSEINREDLEPLDKVFVAAFL